MLIEELNASMPSYKEYLLSKKLKGTSINQYCSSIERFIRYIDNNYVDKPSKLEYVNFDHIKRYIEYRKACNYSIGDLELSKNVIGYYFLFMYDKGKLKYPIYLKDIVITTNEYRKRQIEHFTVEEMETIISYAKEIYNNTKRFESYRNYIIIVLLYYAALTSSEIANIKISDLDFKNNKLKIDTSRKRIIHISKKLMPILNEYLDLRMKYNKSNYLFTSQKNKGIDQRTIQVEVNKIIKNSGIDIGNRKPTPQTIRHTAIKTMVENDLPLHVITNITGLDAKTIFGYYQLYTTFPELKEELYLEENTLL